MRLSLNWLADLVSLNVAPEVLAERLTMAGLEIDAIERLDPEFSGVVVGRVTAVEPHPQADRLRLAEVTTGTETYRVVCGAPNLEAGRLYPFAPIGAVVSGHKIKAAKLRGVASEGMLCAEDELGLSQDHVGLMAIPQDLPLGADLAEALKIADVVLEVAVTANRSDCLSILGLAREVAALLDLPLRHPEVPVAPAAGPPEFQAKVTILDPVHCPRYAARLLTGLTVKPSPFWMRRRLQVSGIRAINNLVDVTNYVLLEFGQPLHAFDFTRLGGGEIVVRLPRQEERRFTTLDGQERELTAGHPADLRRRQAGGPGRGHGGARFGSHRGDPAGAHRERLFQPGHHPAHLQAVGPEQRGLLPVRTGGGPGRGDPRPGAGRPAHVPGGRRPGGGPPAG